MVYLYIKIFRKMECLKLIEIIKVYLIFIDLAEKIQNQVKNNYKKFFLNMQLIMFLQKDLIL